MRRSDIWGSDFASETGLMASDAGVLMAQGFCGAYSIPVSVIGVETLVEQMAWTHVPPLCLY